jgi:hypothetical protein
MQASSYYKVVSLACAPEKVVAHGFNSTFRDSTAYSETDAINVYVKSRGWLQATTSERFKIMFHEWYHVVQYHLTYPVGLAGPTWLIEGSAEWAGFTAAAHFGFYGSFAAAKAQELVRARVPTVPLSSLEHSMAPAGGDAYNLAFVAVDYLVANRGGLSALRKYWGSIGGGTDWGSAFKAAFGRSAGRFYKDFAAYRGRGFGG